MSVKFSNEEMLEMEKNISSFFEKKNIKLSAPVDIFALASELGFDIRGAEFEEPLEGILLVNEELEIIKSFNSNKVIAYNCRRDINSKKFIVAHELAHYIYEKKDCFDTKIVVAARDHQKAYSDDKQEQMMDYMAAAILIPKRDMIKNFRSKDKDKAKLTESVAAKYNVDIRMAARRVEEVFGE